MHLVAHLLTDLLISENLDKICQILHSSHLKHDERKWPYFMNYTHISVWTILLQL